MKWIENNGKSVFSLTSDEVERIADILKTKESVLEARYKRYRDKIDGGEATDKDADKMYDAQEDLDLVREFIKNRPPYYC